MVFSCSFTPLCTFSPSSCIALVASRIMKMKGIPLKIGDIRGFYYHYVCLCALGIGRHFYKSVSNFAKKKY